MRKTFPPLRIHIWGGLGSQLFAIALAFKIQNDFPKRELLLVLHSSGVTQRRPEVCELFPEFTYQEVDDFSDRKTHDSNIASTSLKSTFKLLLKNCVVSTGLLAEENDGKTRTVRRWTLSVRGHYFHREVNKEFILILSSRLKKVLKINTGIYREKIILHYRLGDLLELTNKTNINPQRIAKILLEEFEGKEVTIFSDSPETAISLLKAYTRGIKLNFEDLNTTNTIWAASNANVFFGTSSKVSYWILLLRFMLNQNSKNFMPVADRRVIEIMAPEETNVRFY